MIIVITVIVIDTVSVFILFVNQFCVDCISTDVTTASKAIIVFIFFI